MTNRDGRMVNQSSHRAFQTQGRMPTAEKRKRFAEEYAVIATARKPRCVRDIAPRRLQLKPHGC